MRRDFEGDFFHVMMDGDPAWLHVTNHLDWLSIPSMAIGPQRVFSLMNDSSMNFTLKQCGSAELMLKR